jgi:hypothetical protein
MNGGDIVVDPQNWDELTEEINRARLLVEQVVQQKLWEDEEIDVQSQATEQSPG